MPAATRIGDADVTHCSTPYRAQGSPNVMVNGIPWSRQGDLNTVHLKPCPPKCCPHAMPIAVGSSTVIVNGRGSGPGSAKVCPEHFPEPKLSERGFGCMREVHPVSHRMTRSHPPSNSSS